MDKEHSLYCTSSILLNGVRDKQFHCKRGVRHGDPLSPDLYSLGSDLRQSTVNDFSEDTSLLLSILVIQISLLSNLQKALC